MRAHPRSRGENGHRCRGCRVLGGSSPLTRGKRRDQLGDCRVVGLIPAHAGKTSAREWPRCASAAHPRSRGENEVDVGDCEGGCGSSPLTRGKRDGGRGGERRGGLIPAHAGKTSPAGQTRDRGRAHPRSRGENTKGAGNALLGAGSSPLTRGKPGQWVRRVARRGLIPAHAGKTECKHGEPVSDRAHPRSRGENRVLLRARSSCGGSSPLTRGKQNGILRAMRECGLIPAHAGKTKPSTDATRACRAHPRSRGENQSRHSHSVKSRGSSPLTRGKRAHRAGDRAGYGLIPAHAGKTIP